MVFFTGQRVISVFLCDLASLRSVSGPYCKVPTAQEPIEYVDEPPCSIVEVYIADIGLGRTFEMYVDQPLCISNTSLTTFMYLFKEWESNASRHVSIRIYLDQITHMIIRWRKLELRLAELRILFLSVSLLVC